MHNCNKYSLPNFNEILSIDSKFDTINKFYKDIPKLNNVKSPDDKKQKKADVLKKCNTALQLVD